MSINKAGLTETVVATATLMRVPAIWHEVLSGPQFRLQIAAVVPPRKRGWRWHEHV